MTQGRVFLFYLLQHTRSQAAAREVRTLPGSTSAAVPGHDRRHRQTRIQLRCRRGHRSSRALFYLMLEQPVLLPEQAVDTQKGQERASPT